MLHSPSEQRQGIGLVVINGIETAATGGSDHGVLVGIALAGGVTLDGAHGDGLVRDLMVFAPGRDVGQKAAVGVGRIDAGVAATSSSLRIILSLKT
jgi:hypothetical protein